MKQSDVVVDQSDFFSCTSKQYSPLLRLVATTRSIDEFCSKVEGLLVHAGLQAKCTFHQPPDMQSLEDYIHEFFPKAPIDQSSDSEILGDLRLSRTRHVSSIMDNDSHGDICRCIQIQKDSFVLIPTPSSSFGFSWLTLQVFKAPGSFHLSEGFIESLQWALFLQIERNSHNAICGASLDNNLETPLAYKNNSNLTKRQNQIVILVREDMANSDIGIYLHISTSLVKLELGKVFKILGISNRKELFDPPRF